MSHEHALEHARCMIHAGVDILDIGGESSRPGALPISLDEELNRVLPIIQKIRTFSDIAISIDTSKAIVMKEAINAGASMINDIRALQSEHALGVAASSNVVVCLMHMQGEPITMQSSPAYTNSIINEVNAFFKQRIYACEHAGILRERLVLDPGFGFGKTVQDNLMLLKNLDEFHQHGLPIMLGVSRKSTIGAVLNQPVDKRLIGSVAIAVYAAMHHMAMIRTHDVEETLQALQMVDAIERVS